MYDIAIVGAGPAGASAAIFAAKAGKKTVVFDNDKGMTRRAWILNHYGVKDINGPDMVDLGKQQARDLGAEIIDDTVVNITKIDGGFRVETEKQQSFEAAHIILATGATTELAEKIGVRTKEGTEPRIKQVIDVDAEGKTSVEGIWAAGTAAGVSVHTIITAGDGAKVAINIISKINGERYVDHDILKA